MTYSCDIELAPRCGADLAELNAHGSMRFGPFTSKLSMKSTYIVRGDKFLFESYRIEAPTVRFFHDYLNLDHGIEFHSSKKPEKYVFSRIDEAWWDPLALLLQVQKDVQEKTVRPTYNTFSKNKFTELVSEEFGGGIRLLKNEKPLLTINEEKDGSLQVEINKLGAKLKLSN